MLSPSRKPKSTQRCCHSLQVLVEVPVGLTSAVDMPSVLWLAKSTSMSDVYDLISLQIKRPHRTLDGRAVF